MDFRASEIMLVIQKRVIYRVDTLTAQTCKILRVLHFAALARLQRSTYLVREVRVIASPLKAPSLSNVTELLINMKMAENPRAADELSKKATDTRRIQSNTELHGISDNQTNDILGYPMDNKFIRYCSWRIPW